MLPDTSIRTRLAIAIGVLLLALFILATLSFRGFQSLSDSTRELVDQQSLHAFLANRTNQHSQTAARHLLRLLLTTEREARVPLYAAMDEALAIGDQALMQLENAAREENLAGDLAEVRRLRTVFGDSFQATVELIELSGPRSAQGHFEAQTEPALKALLAATDRLAVAQQDAMQAEVEMLTTDAAAMQQRLVLISVLALVAGAALAGLIARSIVVPVNAAANVAESIAAGNYDVNIPLGGNDEVCSMLRALAAMRERIAQREAHITRLAYVDTLTDLPNRTRFVESFAQLPTHSGLRVFIGECDVLARFWADEFALLLCSADADHAQSTAEEICIALRAPLDINGQRLDLDASIGIAMFPSDGSDLTILLRRADTALRSAKRRHVGVAMAQAVKEPSAPEQLSLIGEMRVALSENQFVPFYQPKMNLRSRQITGAEALIRWRHPTRGLVPPGLFIPFAEQTGFIREITPWLVTRVIRDTAAWRRDGLDLVVSANLSTYDLLNAELIEDIIATLAAEQLPPASLCLEITESALMDEPELALRHLDRLASAGIKLSIDDYGSGQASLSYVKDLPVNELKIDRVFVTDVDTTPKNAAIVRSTTLLCRELGLSVVAEGAEREGEIEWLAANDCDLVQGYGVARPMPEDDFLAFVRNFGRA